METECDWAGAWDRVCANENSWSSLRSPSALKFYGTEFSVNNWYRFGLVRDMLARWLGARPKAGGCVPGPPAGSPTSVASRLMGLGDEGDTCWRALSSTLTVSLVWPCPVLSRCSLGELLEGGLCVWGKHPQPQMQTLGGLVGLSHFSFLESASPPRLS